MHAPSSRSSSRQVAQVVNLLFQCGLMFSLRVFFLVCVVSSSYSSFVFLRQNDQMLGAIRCLDRALLYPPENPVMCHYAKPLNDTFVVGCCKDYDLCNRDLKPVLHVRNVTGKGSASGFISLFASWGVFSFFFYSLFIKNPPFLTVFFYLFPSTYLKR